MPSFPFVNTNLSTDSLPVPGQRVRMLCRRLPLLLSATLSLILPGKAEALSDDDIVTSEPLNTLSAGPGETLFETMDPAKTGVTLVHPIKADHPLRRLYAFGWATGGVAIGDVNGDGRPDLFFSGGPVPPRLYLQTGEMRFEDATVQAGIPVTENFWGAGAAMGDIDNDGDLDLYLTAYDSPNLLLINESRDGHLAFVEKGKEHGVDGRDGSLNASFCDYDRDGDLDLYVQIYHLEPESGRPNSEEIAARLSDPAERQKLLSSYVLVRQPEGKIAVFEAGRPDFLLKNDGTGRFSIATSSAGIVAGRAYGTTATWMDADNDGWPDLHVGNDGIDPDLFYLNETGGRFQQTAGGIFSLTSWNTRGAAAGDFNNDLLVDLFSGNGGSASRQETHASGFPYPDVIQRMMKIDGAPQTNRNVMQLNTGTARFIEAAWLTDTALTGNVWSVKAGDFDCDGRLDAFLTTGAVRDRLSISQGDYSGSNLVGKTRWDLLQTAPERREPDRAFRNRGELRFDDVGSRWGLDDPGMSYAAGTGDLDGDGDLDLVVCRAGEPVAIYRNHATNNRISIRLVGKRSNTAGIGAEVIIAARGLVQVRQLYPTGGFMGSDEPLVHFGLGDIGEVDRLTIRWPSGAVETLQNLQANHRHTITEAISRVPPLIRIPRTKPFFTPGSLLPKARVTEEFSNVPQPLAPGFLTQLGPGQAWGDLTGDGKDSLFLPGSGHRPGRLVHSAPLASSGRSPFSLHAAAEDTASLFFDADGDGDLDLFVASGGVEVPADSPLLRDRLYLNQSEGQFVPAPEDSLPDVRDSSGPAAAADFDRDGDVDLFVGSRSMIGKYPTTPSNRLIINDGKGKFTEATTRLAPGLQTSGMATSALWTDVDNDGWLDLLVAHDWGPIRLWKNKGGQLQDAAETAGLAQISGQWNGLAGRDIDNDGDIDYVATNTGLNTKLKVTPEHPAEVFYGDVTGDGRPILLEILREKEQGLPARAFHEWTAAVPSFEQRFGTSQKFAAAGIEALFPPARRAGAFHLAVNTLASGLLINDGTGRFTFQPLPPMAQMAPAYGVVLTDFNSDGLTDCFLTHNRETGNPEADPARNGLSLLLLGTGVAGSPLRAVRPEESGIIITGPGRSVAVLDFNNDEKADLTVGIHNATPATFLNQLNSKKYQPLKVRLDGRGKSPEGARVTVQCAGMPLQVAEYHAGGGHLSQSPPVLFFGAPADSKEPARILIRWPDGATTRSSVYFD